MHDLLSHKYNLKNIKTPTTIFQGKGEIIIKNKILKKQIKENPLISWYEVKTGHHASTDGREQLINLIKW